MLMHCILIKKHKDQLIVKYRCLIKILIELIKILNNKMNKIDFCKIKNNIIMIE